METPRKAKSLDEIYRENVGEVESGWGRPKPSPDPWSEDPWKKPLLPPESTPFSPSFPRPDPPETERERADRKRSELDALAKLNQLLKPPAPAPTPLPAAPPNPLGQPTARDALLAQALGSRAEAFERAFGVSLLALLIEDARAQRTLSAPLAELLGWAINTGASLDLLAKAKPLAVLDALRLGELGLAIGARLIEMGLRVPPEVQFQSASGRKAQGTPLHALFSPSYASSPQLANIARVLATPERLALRDSEGYSVCGRLNLELSRNPAHKANLIQAFETLVALGADPTDLAPGAATLAADPAIARAAAVEIERKALESASRPAASPGAGSRL